MQSHASYVVVYNGLNFAEWSEQVSFHLGALDLDLALLEDKPPALTRTSLTAERNLMNNWIRSNRLCLMFMKMTVAGNIKVSLPEVETAKEFMEELKKRSKTADKSLASTLMAQLTTMKYDGKSTMHDHILEMTSLVAKLKTIGMTVDDSFVIQFIINSLPKEVYGPFHMTYNLNKDVWTLNELTNQLIEESRHLGPYKPHTINLTNDHEVCSSKGKPSSSTGKNKINSAMKVGVKDKCHFYHKAGHMKKDFPKRKQ